MLNKNQQGKIKELQIKKFRESDKEHVVMPPFTHLT
jgi:hypothetical protein